MNIHSLTIPLSTTPEHMARLRLLQQTFAEVCNALAPVVRDTRCWNRVALHHMMYKTLREQFPQLGSQMVCNAIYSVSRTSRLVFQAEHSPFNIQLIGDKPLPLLQFLNSAPVYFDRHTLSLKQGSLSMYTLDGRMRFELNLLQEDFQRFKTLKLSEVILRLVEDKYTLSFSFGGDSVPGLELEDALSAHANLEGVDAHLPEYVIIDQTMPAMKVLNSDQPQWPSVVADRPTQAPGLVNLHLQQTPSLRPEQRTQVVPTVSSQTVIQIQVNSK
jgi:hypothetical protein